MIRIHPGGRTICEAVAMLPLSAGAAWGQLRDFQSTATHDPFHASVSIEDGRPHAGAKLLIEHRYLLFRSVRAGRILIWRERVGLAFSDLARRNARGAFPHVVHFHLEPVDERNCRLRVRVTGRWTLPGPRWIGRLWLWWVFTQLVRNLTNHLLMFAIAMGSGKRVGSL